MVQLGHINIAAKESKLFLSQTEAWSYEPQLQVNSEVMED